MLFRGWPVMVHDTYTRRRRLLHRHHRRQGITTTRLIQLSNNRLHSESAITTKVSNLNQKWCGIWIWNSTLIWIRIQTSAGLFPQSCGFTLSASVIGDCMTNANKSPKIRYSATLREVENWSGIRIQDHTTSEVNQFFRLIGPIITTNFNKSAEYFCSNTPHRQN